jgi:hypothetical protein
MIVKHFSSAAWAAGLAVFGLAGVGCTATATAGPAGPAPPASSGCAPDSSVACTGGGGGFSCAEGDVPSDSDPSLACSVGVVTSGEALYCCVAFTSSSCRPDETVQGCTGYSYGFSCTGNDSPDQTDSSLVCSQPSQGNDALLYCCTR